MRRPVVAALVALLGPLTALGGAARADDAEASTEVAPARSEALATLRRGRPEQGFGEEGAGWVDVGVTSGPWRDGSVLILGTEVGARLGLTEDARVALSWGVAWAAPRVVGIFPTVMMDIPYDETIERVEARNPEISVEWAPYVAPFARLSVGLGLAVPSAAVATFGTALNGGPTTGHEAAIVDASRVVHAAWMAMNGGWGAWRYQADHLAIVVPVGASFDAGPLVIDVEAAGALSMAVLGGTGGNEGILGLAADLHGRPLPELDLGLRGSITGLRLGGAAPEGLPAVEPWIRLDLAPVTATLRGVVGVVSNGLGTLGAAPEATVAWSVHLSAGVALESTRD